MSADVLTTMILKRLDAAPRVELTWSDLRSASDDEIAALVDARLLVRSGRAEWTLCHLCDEGHKAAVQYLDPSLAPDSPAYYDCPTAGRDWLSPDQLRKWTATTAALCKMVSEFLGLPGESTVVDGCITLLGKLPFAGSKHLVVVAAGASLRNARSLYSRETTQQLLSNAIVLSLSRTLTESLLPPSATCIFIGRLLRIENFSITLDALELFNVVRTHLPYNAEANAGLQLKPAVFVPSPDFHTVRLHGIGFRLTPIQARVVEALWEAAQQGTPELSSAYLLEEVAETTQKRMQSVFKSLPDWKKLIALGTKRGTYRLNL